MNGIVTGKSEKPSGINFNFKVKQENTQLYYHTVYMRNVEPTDFMRLVRYSPQTGFTSTEDLIISVNSLWRDATTASSTRIYPVYNDLTYVLVMWYTDKTVRIGTLYDDANVDAVYKVIQIGTLEVF